MRVRSLADEARQCREWAEEFAGRPEGPMFLRIAGEFDEIARAAASPADGGAGLKNTSRASEVR